MGQIWIVRSGQACCRQTRSFGSRERAAGRESTQWHARANPHSLGAVLGIVG